MTTARGVGPVLVLGATGAVGAHVVEELRSRNAVALRAGRRMGVDRHVDLTDAGLDSYRSALDGVEVVVNASGFEDPRLLSYAADHGAHFVEISASRPYLAALQQLSISTTAVYDVGLAPGLTNLLAYEAHSHNRDAPIDIVIVLGAGEKHGAAATEWTYNLLGRSFDTVDGPIRNYTHGANFTLPQGNTRRLYRVDFSDQHSLTADLGIDVRTYLGLDSASATRLLAAMTWIPGARRAPRNVPLPGGDDWLILAQAGDTRRWVRGKGQSKSTAAITAAAAMAVGSAPAGVHALHTVMTSDELPNGIVVEGR